QTRHRPGESPVAPFQCAALARPIEVREPRPHLEGEVRDPAALAEHALPRTRNQRGKQERPPRAHAGCRVLRLRAGEAAGRRARLRRRLARHGRHQHDGQHCKPACAAAPHQNLTPNVIANGSRSEPAISCPNGLATATEKRSYSSPTPSAVQPSRPSPRTWPARTNATLRYDSSIPTAGIVETGSVPSVREISAETHSSSALSAGMCANTSYAAPTRSRVGRRSACRRLTTWSGNPRLSTEAPTRSAGTRSGA